MEAILIKTASCILPGTPYEEALSILRSEMAAHHRSDNIRRRLELQSMLVHNDPLAPVLLRQLNGKKNFRECFKIFQNFPWPDPKPFQIRLGRRQCVFANRRACMMFCYHRDIVAKWSRLRGAPRNIQVPKKTWTFATPTRSSSILTMAEAIENVRKMPPFYPPDALWGDIMMDYSSSDSD